MDKSNAVSKMRAGDAARLQYEAPAAGPGRYGYGRPLLRGAARVGSGPLGGNTGAVWPPSAGLGDLGQRRLDEGGGYAFRDGGEVLSVSDDAWSQRGSAPVGGGSDDAMPDAIRAVLRERDEMAAVGRLGAVVRGDGRSAVLNAWRANRGTIHGPLEPGKRSVVPEFAHAAFQAGTAEAYVTARRVQFGDVALGPKQARYHAWASALRFAQLWDVSVRMEPVLSHGVLVGPAGEFAARAVMTELHAIDITAQMSPDIFAAGGIDPVAAEAARRLLPGTSHPGAPMPIHGESQQEIQLALKQQALLRKGFERA